MKFFSARYYTIFTIIALHYKKQQATATDAELIHSLLENTNDFLKNPNSDTVPMVPAPIELTGAWTGTNCGMNDTEPVLAELEMAQNGVNVWSFEDKETGQLLRQTGEGVEVIVGFQCVDVGRGYWWGMVPYSDVLWCNLFQVEEVSSNDHTTLVSYINLAYGAGEGVGAVSTGECPTNLMSPDPSINHLQASFTKRIVKSSETIALTCNVPAGSADRVQPSHNSQFPSGAPIPNPFTMNSTSTSTSRLRAVNASTGEIIPARNQDMVMSLPIMSQTTCKMGVDEDELTKNTSAAFNIGGFTIAATMAFLLSWLMAL